MKEIENHERVDNHELIAHIHAVDFAVTKLHQGARYWHEKHCKQAPALRPQSRGRN